MTKADDVYLEDITENTLDFAPEVADSLGMSLSEYLKLSLPQRIDLTEKFIWKKKQGGFVNGYQSEGTVKKIVEETAEEVIDISKATIDDAIDAYIKVLQKEKTSAKLLKQNVTPLENIRTFLKQNNLLDTPISAFQDKNFVDKFWLQVQDIADLDLEKGERSFFVSPKGELVESKSRMLHSKLGTAMSKVTGWKRAAWDDILKVQPVDLDSGFFSKSTRIGFDFGDEGMNKIVRAIKNIKNPQARNLALIKLFTGIRTSDLKELTLAQIDLDRRILEYIGGKKGQATVGKPQTVSELVASALRDQLQLSGTNNPEGLLFRNADALEKQAIKEIRESIAAVSDGDGKIFKVKKWNSSLGKIDSEAVEFNFKMLRNAIAKTVIGEGASYNQVATVLGHFKGSDVTLQYYGTTSVRPVPDKTAYKLMTQVQSNYLQFAGFNSPAEYGKSIGLINTSRLPHRHIFSSEQKAFQLQLEGTPSSKTKAGFTLEPIPSGEATTQDVTKRLTDVEVEATRIKEEQAKISGEFKEKQRLKKVKTEAAKILKNLGLDIKTLKSITPWLATTVAGGLTWAAPKAKAIGFGLKTTAAALTPLEPFQAYSQVVGGEEGVLPKDKKLLGIFEPTTKKELEAINKMIGVPMYPEGHPKEGQAIYSTKEYKQMKMPEELEQFEQQGRF